MYDKNYIFHKDIVLLDESAILKLYRNTGKDWCFRDLEKKGKVLCKNV